MSLDLVLGPPRVATGDADQDEGGGSSMPLDTLFTCERFGPLTHKACRRRQLELRLVDDDKKPGKKLPGPPIYEYCASGECVTGAAIAAELEAEDVSTATCPKCGGAFVGPEADEPCPACAPARAADRARRAEYSSRIWAGEVPNTAIAPPPRRGGLTEEQEREIAARVAAVATGRRRPRLAPAPPSRAPDPTEPLGRELAPAEKRVEPVEVGGHATSPGKPGTSPAPTAPVHAAPTSAPASPAEEEPMEKICSNCKKKPLRSDNTSGICSACRKAPEKNRAKDGAAPPAKASPAPAKVTRIAKAPRLPRRRDRAADLEAMTAAELASEREHALEFVEAIDEEVGRRRAQLDEMFPKRSTGTEG